MVIEINYANVKYQSTQKWNTWSAKYIGKFDKVIAYTEQDVDKDFITKHHEIFDIERRNGLFLWKPYLIDKTLKNLAENDYLFYCDSGCFFVRNKKYIIDYMIKNDLDFWISQVPLVEKQYTTGATFELMECNNPTYKESNQYNAAFMVFRCCEWSRSFVKEWLYYCTNPLILNDYLCTPYKNDEQYIEHRWDQSVLSLLCKKYHVKAHLDPSQYGVFQWYYRNDEQGRIFLPYEMRRDYPMCIIHHRKPRPNLLMLCSSVYSFVPQMITEKWGKRKFDKKFGASHN